MRTRPRRPPRPAWVQVLLATLLGLLFIAIYLGFMRYTIDISRPNSTYTPSERDTFYLGLHAAVLVGAAIAGFALGKWLNGLGLAYAVLLLAIMFTTMVAAQAGSQTLACRGGHNDIIRHWTC